jgi:hypothetical protein
VPLGPIVPGTGLPEDEVIRPEDLPERPGSDGVHGPRLQIHEHRARDVSAAAGLVVIDINALELELRVAAIPSGVVDAMLVADHLPELGPDLVAALPALDVQDFSHSYPIFLFRFLGKVRKSSEVCECGTDRDEMGLGCVGNGWNWRVKKGSEVGCVNRRTWLGVYLEK